MSYHDDPDARHEHRGDLTEGTLDMSALIIVAVSILVLWLVLK